MGDIGALVRSLRGFARNDILIREVRAELRAPVPIVRTRIKATARATLPHSGGLGGWVAGTRITAKVMLGGKSVTIRLRGGRNSKHGRSDIRAIDRGRLRHPSWGRRGRGQWFTQAVTPGFFTKTAAEAPEWDAAIDRAMARAVAQL